MFPIDLLFMRRVFAQILFHWPIGDLLNPDSTVHPSVRQSVILSGTRITEDGSNSSHSVVYAALFSQSSSSCSSRNLEFRDTNFELLLFRHHSLSQQTPQRCFSLLQRPAKRMFGIYLGYEREKFIHAYLGYRVGRGNLNSECRIVCQSG